MKYLARWKETSTSIFLFIVLVANCATAATVKAKVSRAAEVPFPKALLVVVSLETGREAARELTGKDGTTSFELTKGLYQVYLTYPVSHYPVRVFELSVGNERQRDINVLLPSTGILESVIKPIARRRIQFVDEKGQPSANRDILVRDVQGSDGMQRWYKTDGSGSADISVLVFPSICVAVDGTTVLSGTLTKNRHGIQVTLLKQNLSVP